MRKTLRLMRGAVVLTAAGVAGCEPADPDERLADLAQKSWETQARQNERMAGQSQQTAEAARHLVEADAKARREMAEAHATLRRDLQEEREGIEQQRAEIERERRDLAARRARDPIIAETIGAVGQSDQSLRRFRTPGSEGRDADYMQGFVQALAAIPKLQPAGEQA